MKKRERGQRVIGIARGSRGGSVETREVGISDSETLPAVRRELCGRIDDDLTVVGDIVFQHVDADRRRIRQLKIHVIAKARAVVDRGAAGVVVLIEAVVHVVERETVFQNVLGVRAGAAELEAIAVAREIAYAPKIEAVGEGPAIFQRDGIIVVVEIPTVVGIIPRAAAAENVAFAVAGFGGKSVAIVTARRSLKIAIRIAVQDERVMSAR